MGALPRRESNLNPALSTDNGKNYSSYFIKITLVINLSDRIRFYWYKLKQLLIKEAESMLDIHFVYSEVRRRFTPRLCINNAKEIPTHSKVRIVWKY